MLAGCTKVLTEVPYAAPINEGLVFTASFSTEGETKTVLDTDQSTVLWSGKESIVVFDFNNKGYEFSTTDKGKTADFTPVGSEALEDPDTWYALYPYEENAKLENGVFTATLANEYHITGPGSFSDNMNIAVAKSDTYDFSFKNVLSWLKVSYKGLADVTKIEFRGNNNEDVAGTLLIDYTDDLPKASIKEGSGSKTMTITLEGQESESSSKRTYFYLPVLPGVFENGITLTFTSKDGISRTYTKEVSIEFPRHVAKSVFAELSANTYERVDDYEDIDQVSDAKYLLVYPVGSEYRVFSFQKTMENIVAEAARLKDVHTLDDLKDEATTIYQNALKSNYILASSTDDGLTITIDKQEEEENAVFAVTGDYNNAKTTLSANVGGEAYTLKLENITVELKDNNAALISAVLNGQDIEKMSTALRGHEITLTIENCIDYVGTKFGLDAAKLAMAKAIFLEFCELVGEYTGKPFDVDLNTTVTKFYAQYWDNIRDYAMLYAPDKKWGSIYPVGFYNADNGFTFNVPAPNKVWFYDFEESTSRDIDYFETYWTNMNGYHNFPFGLIAQKLAAKLRTRPEAFVAIQSINFASIGDTYQRYVDRFNDSLEEVYIYRLVE